VKFLDLDHHKHLQGCRFQGETINFQYIWSPKPKTKGDFLDALLSLGRSLHSKHWIVGVDINLVTSLKKKKRGRFPLEEYIIIFKNIIEELRMLVIDVRKIGVLVSP
jgi:hypothetical protein